MWTGQSNGEIDSRAKESSEQKYGRAIRVLTKASKVRSGKAVLRRNVVGERSIDGEKGGLGRI